MSIFDQIIGIIAPHDCLGCQAEGALLCLACSQTLSFLPKRCYRCQKPAPEPRTCLECSITSNLSCVYVAVAYSGLAKDLVWKLKFDGGQAAARPMALLMKKTLNFSPDMLICPVPTATSRARSRGYDQAVLLARQLSQLTRLPYSACLSRVGHAHQVGADRKKRLAQLENAYLVKWPRSVQNANILLVDDVLTTGSTLETAAKALKNAGAARIDAITFAQA